MFRIPRKTRARAGKSSSLSYFSRMMHLWRQRHSLDLLPFTSRDQKPLGPQCFGDPGARPKSLELGPEGRRASAPSDSRSGHSTRRWRTRLQDGQTSPVIPNHGGQSSKVPRRRSTSETTNSDPRSQPAHVSTNSTQGSRTSAAGKKIKTTSEADLYPEDNHPVSIRSLPDFLKAKPALFWPRGPNGKERQPVVKDKIVRDPDTTFLQGDPVVVGGVTKVEGVRW